MANSTPVIIIIIVVGVGVVVIIIIVVTMTVVEVLMKNLGQLPTESKLLRMVREVSSPC